MDSRKKPQRDVLLDIKHSMEFLTLDNSYCPVQVYKGAYDSPWGRLFAYSKSHQSISRNIYLFQDKYVAGRVDECTINISKYIRIPKIAAAVSKSHFTIERVYEDGQTKIVLTDTSSNGTFVNQKLVGIGQNVVLQNKDRISLCRRKFVVFKFKIL